MAPHRARQNRIKNSTAVGRWSSRRRLRFEPLEDRRLLSITVDTLVDEDDGTGMGGVSLRDAIAAAMPGDTIDFSVAGTITLTHHQLTIDKTLNIVGPGANLLTIDANGSDRVFNVDNSSASLSSVSIAGLTITGGSTGADGGGILNRETLTVTACNITGNAAEDGGGIGNFSGTFSLLNSTVSNNTAFGVLGGGAGIYNFCDTLGATSTIKNSTISSNTTTTTGGGIYNFKGTIVVEYSTLTKNDAPTSKGSGIASWADNMVASTQVRPSIIAGNLHSDVDIVGSFIPSFQSNGYNLIGFGNSTGLFTTTGDVRDVTDPQLGPLTDNGGPTPTHFPLRGSPAIDTGNPGAAAGMGGVPAFDQRGTPFVRVFDGDGTGGDRIDKGAVESDAVYFVVDIIADENDGNFSAGDRSLREAIEQAKLVTLGTPTIIFAPSLTSGGPATIHLLFGELKIETGLVINGPGASLLTIDADGGSRVFNIDDADGDKTLAVQLSGLTLTDGFVTNGGGAIFSQERLTVSDSVITGNTAQWGGGIYNAEFGVLTVRRTQITNNHAIEPIAQAFGSGGALYNWGGGITILDSTISGNDSVTHGGGILNANGGYVSIVRSTISSNTAAENGGGISNGDGFMNIASSTLSGNHADQGGGIFVGTPNFQTTTISNSTISGNSAPAGGGGVNNQSGRVVIEFCTITQNVANDFLGSGVASAPSLADSPTTFYSSIVAANFDSNGGAQPNAYDVAVKFDADGENSLTSLGYNIIGSMSHNYNVSGDFVPSTGDQTGVANPRLGSLGSNGGPTQTHALLAGSPAIDHGDPNASPGLEGVPKFDQRGTPFSRIRDGTLPASIFMDIGAFEAQGIPAALPGDYNLNSIVDTADYASWRNTLGTSVVPYTGADGDGDGKVDQDDYIVWRANFGKTPPPPAAGSSVVTALAEPAAPAGQPLALPVVSVAKPLTGIELQTVPPAEPGATGTIVGQAAKSRTASPARLHDEGLLAWFSARRTWNHGFDQITGPTEPGSDGSGNAADHSPDTDALDAAITCVAFRRVSGSAS